MKKRVMSIVICLGILFALAGCVSDSSGSTTSDETSAAETSAAESSAAAETADGVSAATEKETSDPNAVVKGLSKDGYWILALLSDVTVTEPIYVDGEFHDKGDDANDVYRKLALYAQDENRNVTEEYILTVPRMEVTSPNFRIQNGTVKGDVYINADGFDLNNCEIDGDLYFATQAQMDSATLDTGNVTGVTEIGEYSE